MAPLVKVLGASALFLAVAVVVAGCASSRSVLYKGWVKPGSGQRIVFSDAMAVERGRSMRKQWLADIARAGRERPKPLFHNLSESRVRARLTASGDQFTVKRVEFFHPRQADCPRAQNRTAL